MAKQETPPSPPSPTASFYDMSDDEEDDYNTIRHSRSGKGVKLLFSKSKVGRAHFAWETLLRPDYRGKRKLMATYALDVWMNRSGIF